MKLDMELVRKIAILIEEHPHGYAPKIVIEGYTQEQIGYHVYQMGEGGLLNVLDMRAMGCDSPMAEASSLTWEGHQFVATARSETVWNKSRSLIRDKVGTASIAVLVEVLKQQAKHMLGLP